MKILYISRRFYPDIIGGGEVSAFFIAQSLALKGHDVHVLTFSPGLTGRINETLQGVNVHRYPLFTSRFRRWANLDLGYLDIRRKAKVLIAELQPDIIHLLNFESIPYTAQMIRKTYHLPMVATVNGLSFGCFTQVGLDRNDEPCLKCTVGKRLRDSIDKWGWKGALYWIYSLWYMPLIRRSYSVVNRFFPVSKAVIPIISNMGVSPARLSVIPNPIEPAHVSHRKITAKDMGLPQEMKILLFAGRLVAEKGLDKIIDALPQLPGYALVVLGKGDFSRFNRQAQERRVADRVKHIGHIDNADISSYYQASDCVMLIGKFYEPLSRMLLEALSNCVPTVAYDRGSNRELVDGKTGILITSQTPEVVRDAVLRATSPEFRNAARKACAERIKEFSLESVGARLEKEYRNVIKEYSSNA